MVTRQFVKKSVNPVTILSEDPPVARLFLAVVGEGHNVLKVDGVLFVFVIPSGHLMEVWS